MLSYLWPRLFATLPVLITSVAVEGTPISSKNGVYDTSVTPGTLPWNTYNYCNAPHVNAKHYTRPVDSGAKLVYLNVVMRHHKVA